jgi:hypothetical protein
MRARVEQVGESCHGDLVRRVYVRCRESQLFSQVVNNLRALRVGPMGDSPISCKALLHCAVGRMEHLDEGELGVVAQLMSERCQEVGPISAHTLSPRAGGHVRVDAPPV